MENLIVGNDDCKISRIITILKKSPVIGELDGKLLSLALTLGNPPSLKDAVHRNVILFGTIPATEGLVKLLTDWRSRQGDKAKFTTFLEALEKDDLYDFSQRLRDHYTDGGNSSSSSSAGVEASGSGNISGAGIGDQSSGAAGGGDPPEGNRWRAFGDPVAVADDAEALVRRIRNHITKNMPELIELVSWNATLMAKMQAHGIIGTTDAVTLGCIANLNERTNMFFTFIQNRLTPDNLNMYDQVIAAFEEVLQSGVSYVLRKVYSR